MRTIALSILLLLSGGPGRAASEDTPYTRMAKLATYISGGDASSALETFDKSLTNYGTISGDLTALSTQTDVLCAIDVVADKEADDEASRSSPGPRLVYETDIASRPGADGSAPHAGRGHDTALWREMAHHGALTCYDPRADHDKVQML